jgi:hypothetical protein
VKLLLSSAFHLLGVVDIVPALDLDLVLGLALDFLLEEERVVEQDFHLLREETYLVPLSILGSWHVHEVSYLLNELSAKRPLNR